eukprot:GEMP01041852.1.p1 GENE.GEMP01041852.1~~GEMP01041852.1.p1  ORF type:complete len:416 (+),score=86.18 GEMP01041852.1:66-1313(+)
MDRLNQICAHVTAGGNRKKPCVITIVGAGNSGLVCAGLFHGNMNGNIVVQLLTSTPEICSRHPTVTLPDGSVLTGYVSKISSNKEELVGNADVVLWTGPVSATKEVFESIQPYCSKNTIIATIFAQGLVHLLAARIFGRDVSFVAMRNIPWLCRTTKKGCAAEIVGAKQNIQVVGMNVSDAWVMTDFEPLFQVTGADGRRQPTIELIPDFTPIVFNPANQIIHPARYWAIFRKFAGDPLPEKPTEWLYRGMGEDAGVVLECLDEELQSIKDKYFDLTNAEGCKMVIPLRDRLLLQYGEQISDTSTLAKMVGTNKAYSMARTPMLTTEKGHAPNPNHRVVQDDIGWGLCVLLSIAERMELQGVKTPTVMIRAMIDWHQAMMGKQFIVNGKLVGKDCSDLVLLAHNEPLAMVARPAP